MLDAFARTALLFEDATTPVPLTLPAHATILTGLGPAGHGARSNEGSVRAGVPTLAGRLRSAGYRTAAFVSGAPVARGTGLEPGFDLFDDSFPDRPGGNRFPAERTAPRTAGAASRWIASVREPFFLWVHFFDPHAPYTPPAAFGKGDPYDGEVAQEKKQVTDIIDGTAQLLNREMSPLAIAIYVKAIEDLPFEQVSAAFSDLVRQSKFFPPPAELREMILGPPEKLEDVALIESSKVVEAVKRYGGNKSVVFDDPVTMAVIQQVFGGWERLSGELTLDEMLVNLQQDIDNAIAEAQK